MASLLDLRKEAGGLGIPGVWNMNEEALAEAIAKAKEPSQKTPKKTRKSKRQEEPKKEEPDESDAPMTLEQMAAEIEGLTGIVNALNEDASNYVAKADVERMIREATEGLVLRKDFDDAQAKVDQLQGELTKLKQLIEGRPTEARVTEMLDNALKPIREAAANLRTGLEEKISQIIVVLPDDQGRLIPVASKAALKLVETVVDGWGKLWPKDKGVDLAPSPLMMVEEVEVRVQAVEGRLPRGHSHEPVTVQAAIDLTIQPFARRAEVTKQIMDAVQDFVTAIEVDSRLGVLVKFTTIEMVERMIKAFFGIVIPPWAHAVMNTQARQDILWPRAWKNMQTVEALVVTQNATGFVGPTDDDLLGIEIEEKDLPSIPMPDKPQRRLRDDGTGGGEKESAFQQLLNWLKNH